MPHTVEAGSAQALLLQGDLEKERMCVPGTGTSGQPEAGFVAMPQEASRGNPAS